MRISRRFPYLFSRFILRFSPLVLCALAAWSSPAASQRSSSDSLRVLNQARLVVRDHVASQRIRSPRAVRESRARVIDRLDELALASPGDDWIAGHRIGLRVAQGYLDQALAVARECRASPWWCDAMMGFVQHLRGEYQDADEAFERSLAAMSPETRCEWLADLRVHLLSGPVTREFRDAECARQVDLADRYWWLADPFYLIPGNDRKSEHFTRLVAMEMHHQYLHFDGRPCSPGHHAAQVLQGWPEWWWETEGPITDLGPGPGYRFLPGASAWEQPLLAPAAEWSLSARGYDERYDPAYGPVFELEPQVAFFARGGGVTAVAASDLTGHPLGEPATLNAGLVLARDERTPPLIARGEAEDGRLRFRIDAPERRYLVSVEAIAAGGGAARGRFGHGLAEPGPGISLSDLLLWEWRDEVQQDLDSVAPLMLGSSRVPLSATLGVYWETYGLVDGQVVDVSMQALPRERGLFRRLGEALRLVSPPESLRFVWREGADVADAGIVGRTLELDLSGLRPGEYTLELGVRAESGEAIVTEREITLYDG